MDAFAGKPLVSPRSDVDGTDEAQNVQTSREKFFNNLCTPKRGAVHVRLLRNGSAAMPAKTSSMPLALIRCAAEGEDDMCVPTNPYYKQIMIHVQEKLRLAAPVKAMYALDGARRTRISEFQALEVIVVVPQGESLLLPGERATGSKPAPVAGNVDERKALRARWREQRSFTARLSQSKTHVNRVSVSLLPVSLLSKGAGAKKDNAAPASGAVDVTFPAGVELTEAVTLAESALGTPLMPPGCALYTRTGRAIDDMSVIESGAKLYYRAAGEAAPPKAVSRRTMDESVQRLAAPRPSTTTVVITVHRLGAPLDSGSPVTITPRVASLEELYKRVASSAVPPPLNGVKAMYTSRGKVVESVSALKHGQHVSYACFGDAVPLSAAAARRRAMRAVASARRRASRPDLQHPRAKAALALAEEKGKRRKKIKRRVKRKLAAVSAMAAVAPPEAAIDDGDVAAWNFFGDAGQRTNDDDVDAAPAFSVAQEMSGGFGGPDTA